MIKNVCHLLSVICFVFAFILGFPVVSYCNLSTPSDASDSGLYGTDNTTSLDAPFDMEDLENEEDFLEDTEDFYTSDLLSGIYDAVMDIHDLLSPATPSAAEYAEDTEIYETVEPYSDDFAFITPFGASGSFFDRNVVVYTGTFKGEACKLVITSDMQKYIWRNPSDGALYCVSSNPDVYRVVGRLFYTDTFDQSDYNYHLFQLTSVIGPSAPTQLLQTGYMSTRQSYTRATSNTMNQTNTSGLFYASEWVDYSVDSADFRIYVAVVVIAFLIGGILLCSWKNSRQL
ncbi:hypothetical protein [Lacrimispora indolis]|uniref:hypothetical protein n=1 Tax=Lacrimispora indolis TaxID=69825 RepID=UPI0003FEC153|nr:hypothetical protein [[Clostridium] methoxybenzovorans]